MKRFDPETLLARLVEMHAARTPNREALVVGSSTVSYRELAMLVYAARARFDALGLGPGDRALVVMPNCAEYLVSVLAVTSLGATAVPVDATTGPERLQYLVETMRPRLCLHAAGASPPIPGVPSVEVAIDLAAGVLVRPFIKSRAGVCVCPTGPNAPAFILLSSGSTGRPKGVVLKHRHLLATARALSALFGIGPDHRELILPPLCHSDGWQRVAATWMAGGCVVLATGLLSVPAIVDDIVQHRITGFFAAPPLMRFMLAHDPRKLARATAGIRTLEIGSAPITAGELRRLLQQFPAARVFFHYGLTECSRAVVLDARAHADKLHTVGRPSPGVEIAILAEDGARVPPGRAGEIHLRGPQRTDGYWDDPTLDAKRLIKRLARDGEVGSGGPWLATGDYGALDADGFLTLLGRRDDLITCGGHHFFPAEVETELGPVEGVVDYVVAGVRDERGLLEQVPWAFVVPAETASYDPRRFARLARERLPPHMVPRRVVTVPALPLTPSGKPDRRRAIALHAAQPGGEGV